MKAYHFKHGFFAILFSVAFALMPGCEDSTGPEDPAGNSRSPAASIEASQTSGTAPVEIIFTDRSTGEISARRWELSDGRTATDRQVRFNFTSSGYYTVKLTVEGPGGNDSRTIGVTIRDNTPTPPKAVIEANRTSGIAPVSITFKDRSTGNITSRKWELSTGQTSAANQVGFTFNKGGRYTMKLTVEGPGGSDSKTLEVLIDEIVTFNNVGVGPYFPTRTRGDCEFYGNGPKVKVTADLKEATVPLVGRVIRLKLTMLAEETTHDWSTAEGEWYKLLYNIPNDLKVKSFLSQTSMSMSYIDANTDYDYSIRTELGQFVVKGDTNGDDICNTTMDDTHVLFRYIYFKVQLTPM